MARDKPREPKPPRFPRKRWQKGQQERVVEPKKGGAYRRAREHRETDEGDEPEP